MDYNSPNPQVVVAGIFRELHSKKRVTPIQALPKVDLERKPEILSLWRRESSCSFLEIPSCSCPPQCLPCYSQASAVSEWGTSAAQDCALLLNMHRNTSYYLPPELLLAVLQSLICLPCVEGEQSPPAGTKFIPLSQPLSADGPQG